MARKPSATVPKVGALGEQVCLTDPKEFVPSLMLLLPRLMWQGIGWAAGEHWLKGCGIDEWLNDDGKNEASFCDDPDIKHRKWLLNGRGLQGKGHLFFLYSLLTGMRKGQPSSGA